MYLQRKNYTGYNNRSNYKRSSRPTNRILQAGPTGQIFAKQQTVGYLFTATDPCTATNFKLDTVAEVLGDETSPIAYALVYVPEGYDVNTINYPTTAGTNNMYDPSKAVLIAGILSSLEQEDHKYSKYSRKLQTGDRLALIYFNSDDTATSSASFQLSFTTIH